MYKTKNNFGERGRQPYILAVILLLRSKHSNEENCCIPGFV